MSKRLFLSHTAAASGAELALLRLVKNLDPETTAVAFANNGPLVARFREAGVDAYVKESGEETMGAKRAERSPLRLIRSLRLLASYGWRLGAWVADNEISVIVAYSVKSFLYGAVAAKRARVPLVWSVHDRIAADSFGRMNAVALRMLGAVLPDALIVNSKATAATIWALGKPVLTLPPGIETGGVQERGVDARPLKRIIMVGRLCPWKGQMEFIEAFERVFTGTGVEALIVGGALFGEQEYEARLRRRVTDGPCPEQIAFTGAVENVEELLHDSEIMVHASVIPEPFGAVVLEGLDAGCAVIATTPGGPAEIISDGINGLLVPCGDIDALEGALIQLVDDHALRNRLSHAGIKRAADFDVRRLAGQAETWLTAVERPRHRGLRPLQSAEAKSRNIVGTSASRQPQGHKDRM